MIAEEFARQVELPETGVQFSDTSTAFQRVQQYAFATGFAVVETQWDPQQQRRVYSCVHYGKPANRRKITVDTVRKEIFEEMSGVDSEGSRLRQRQGMVRAKALKCAATMSKHMSGPLCSAPPCLEIYQPRKKRSTAKIQQRKTPVDGSQEVPVDLCALDTQERNWIDGYTGGRVAVDLTGSDSEAEVESQDIWKMIEEAAL